MRKRVVITGIGWVTPLGHEIEGVWRRLLGAESGIAATTLFDARKFPTTFSAEVKDYDFERVIGASYPKHRHAWQNTRLALGAAQAAWRGAARDAAHLDPYMVGTYTGAGDGGLDFENFTTTALKAMPEGATTVDATIWGRVALQRFNAMCEIEQEPSMTISHLSMEFNARGPSMNCLTACAASTQAIGEATEIIRRGDADVMISGGAHSMIHPFGVTGFNRLTALSTLNENPRQACRPFAHQPRQDGRTRGEETERAHGPLRFRPTAIRGPELS